MEFMKHVAKVTGGNLLSVPYKDIVEDQRALWRMISLIEHKEEGWGNEVLTATTPIAANRG